MAIDETSVKVRVVTLAGALVGKMSKPKNIRTLDALNLKGDFFALTEASTEGIVTLRGRPVVILRGPATVSLAFPFRVEPIPSDPDNYWEDLRFPTAQFRLQLA